jgi:BirA family biotin operon repressor/biotin-[acetyl-CoA-carboxylase] ligase
MTQAVATASAYDGVPADAIAARLGVPRLVALESTESTLDVAHALAAGGAAAGTVVVAETQTAGRGRSGKRWTSAPGAGIWLTIVERSLDPSTLSLLSLRLGIAAAAALEPFALGPIGVKWPNDLYVGRGKLAGILVEARWRDAAPDWVAIGVGVNAIAPPGIAGAAALRPGVSRVAVLEVLVPALRASAARAGALDAVELTALEVRDIARGRNAVSPGQGIVDGVSPAGELLLRLPNGALVAHRAGSLVFAEDP